MKILITGHKGFIGKNITERLKNSGHDLSYYEWNDLPNNNPAIKGFDWVMHLGAISSTTETNVEKVLRQNLDFSIWLYEQCSKYGVNLQWSSSASVYGPDNPNIAFSEKDPVDPRSPYAWSKYLFERYIETRAINNIKVQGFRYFNVYGSYEDHKGDQASPYHKFSKQATENGKIVLFEGSDQYFRDFVHVDYVTSIHEKFLNVFESGIWNIGTGKPKSFLEIAQSFNVPVDFMPMPESIVKHYQKYTCADTTKLQETLKDVK